MMAVIMLRHLFSIRRASGRNQEKTAPVSSYGKPPGRVISVLFADRECPNCGPELRKNEPEVAALNQQVAPPNQKDSPPQIKVACQRTGESAAKSSPGNRVEGEESGKSNVTGTGGHRQSSRIGRWWRTACER